MAISSVSEKRKRARPRFRSELPLRLERLNPANQRFDRLADRLAGSSQDNVGSARGELIRIARDLAHSRKLQAQMVARPDANQTLKKVSGLAADLHARLSDLPAAIAERLEEYLWLPLSLTGHSTSDLHTVSGVLHELATAAYAANHLPANRARRSGQTYKLSAELTKLHVDAQSLAKRSVACLITPRGHLW